MDFNKIKKDIERMEPGARTLAADVIKLGSQEVAKVKGLLRDHCWDEVQKVGKTIRTAAKSVGLEELGEQAAKLEELAGKQAQGAVEIALQVTEAYLTAVSTLIRPSKGEGKKNADIETEGKKIED